MALFLNFFPGITKLTNDCPPQKEEDFFLSNLLKNPLIAE
jgi:hypothetical protein